MSQHDALRLARYRLVISYAGSVALGRPHDGSQLDEDLQGLLSDVRAVLNDQDPVNARAYCARLTAERPESD